jgi:hypothetical protein|tara:strand:- start:657 stop:1025 length:369 start_codon:yes stop_codon:yes gene_type:complete
MRGVVGKRRVVVHCVVVVVVQPYSVHAVHSVPSRDAYPERAVSAACAVCRPGGHRSRARCVSCKFHFPVIHGVVPQIPEIPTPQAEADPGQAVRPALPSAFEALQAGHATESDIKVTKQAGG